MPTNLFKSVYHPTPYNHLNLPETITIAGGRKNINYIWDAVGNKLSTRTAFLKDLPDDTLETTRTEYIGNFVYKEDDQGNLKPAYILHEEGMIVVDDDGDYHYDYFIKDHLGNTRLVQRITGETTETIQQTDYYPFGMIMGGRDAYPGDDDNRYLYNNKEFQDMFDLGWYDYGARFYDAQIARFHTLDPLAEIYSFQSPFAYAANNPIYYNDYLGMGPREWWKNIKSWVSETFDVERTHQDNEYNQKDNNYDEISGFIALDEVVIEADRVESQPKEDRLYENISKDIGAILGFASSSTEQVMKTMHVTELELRQILSDQGYSTKRIDRIISRTSKAGGVARIGGQLLFWGQAGYNIHNMMMVDSSFENITISSADTFFSGLATYGGWKGIGIAGVYYLGKQSIVITMKSLDQGLVKPNTNIRYSPGLAPSPVIWDW